MELPSSTFVVFLSFGGQNCKHTIASGEPPRASLTVLSSVCRYPPLFLCVIHYTHYIPLSVIFVISLSSSIRHFPIIWTFEQLFKCSNECSIFNPDRFLQILMSVLFFIVFSQFFEFFGVSKAPQFFCIVSQRFSEFSPLLMFFNFFKPMLPLFFTLFSALLILPYRFPLLLIAFSRSGATNTRPIFSSKSCFFCLYLL